DLLSKRAVHGLRTLEKLRRKNRGGALGYFAPVSVRGKNLSDSAGTAHGAKRRRFTDPLRARQSRRPSAGDIVHCAASVALSRSADGVNSGAPPLLAQVGALGADHLLRFVRRVPAARKPGDHPGLEQIVEQSGNLERAAIADSISRTVDADVRAVAEPY